MRNLKRALSLALASVMVLGLMVVGSGASYADVTSEENQEAIEVLQAVGVMVGDDNGNFNPDRNVTRNEMAVVMSNLLDLKVEDFNAADIPFTDVPSWAVPYVAACYADGITAGTSETTYGGSNTVTAVQAALMMMKALGYFQYQGDFEQEWSLAVIKKGSEIGIFDGITVNRTSPLTRNDVAQMALNALKADMVTFTGDVGMEIPIAGGSTINVGYKAEYTSRTGSNSKYNAIVGGKTDIAQQGQYYIQLGEELYNGDLKLNTNATDDFGRPANNWRYNGKDIGSYADKADATYTAKVKVGDIYADLGLGSTIAKGDVTVYVDGALDKNASVAISKNDDTNKFGGNGVLTEVFYDKDNDTVVITLVNTYVGTINRTVAAKGNQDAYVEIVPEDPAPKGASGIQKYETNASFDDDAYVLYTYSQSAEAVKSVALAEHISGTVTRAENSAKDEDQKKALTIDGTRYTASANIAGQDIGSVSVDADYDVYLDSYGYLIYVEENQEIGDYALLVDTQDKANFSSNRALLVFADGTEKVVDTTENYKSGSNSIDNGSIVTYRVDQDGDYTLKAVDTKKVVKTDTNKTVEFGKSDYTDGVTDFAMTNDKASITLTSGKTVTSNSNTVFVVYDDTNDEYTVYTGIKNAPTIKATTGKEVEAFAYCKSGKMATVMFIFVQDGSIIEDGTQNGLFLAMDSVSNLIHDKDGDYFEYQGIVNGEVQTVRVDETLGKNLNGLYKSYTVDKYGIVTKVNNYDPYTTGEKEEVLTGTGIDKVSADYTVILDTVKGGKNETITVADNAKIFYVDKDGNVQVSSYRSIAKDANDKFYAVVKDYLVQTLVIEEMSDKDAEKPVLSDTIEVKGVKIDNNTEIRFYVESGKTTTLSNSDIRAILADEGCTNIEKGNSGWSFYYDNMKYNDVTVKGTQVYAVTYENSGDAVDTWSYTGPAYVANNQKITVTAKHELASTGTSYKFASATGSVGTFSQVTGTATDANGTSTFTATVTISGDGVIKILATA